MTASPTAPDANNPAVAVDAQLLIAPGCAHCPGVLDALAKLTKEGVIGQLQVTNVALHPEAAAAVGTRSVPWCRIGPYVLEGAHDAAELREWANYAGQGAGLGVYVSYLLEHHKLAQAVDLVRDTPVLLHDLVHLLADQDTPMAVRIGIGAIFEDLHDTDLLADLVHPLGALTQSSEPQTRADACHYLGMTGSPAAKAYVTPLLDDPDAEVAEIAAETLPLLPAQDGAAGC